MVAVFFDIAVRVGGCLGGISEWDSIKLADSNRLAILNSASAVSEMSSPMFDKVSAPYAT